MRFGAYVMLIFSISLVFYLMGYKSIAASTLFTNQGLLCNPNGNVTLNPGVGVMTPQNILTCIANGTILPSQTLASIGIAILATIAASLLLGFSAIYIIPIGILIVFFNIFVFPLSFVLDTTDPIMGSFMIPIVIFFNIITVLAIFSFVRGGGT